MTQSSLFFAEFDVDPSKDISELELPLNRVIANLGLLEDWNYHDNCTALIPAFHHRGYLTRGFVLNDEDIWDAAWNAQANILTTDEVRGNSWAAVVAQSFKGPID